MHYVIKPCEGADAEFLWEKNVESAPGIENACEEQKLVFRVTDENGAMRGGCVLDIDKTRTAEYERLWVDEPFRRQGIGSALIREAEQKAREAGCHTIINAYSFEFHGVRPLFERQGFQLLATIRDWPKGHACDILVKRLDSDSGKEVHADPPRIAGCVIETGSEEDGEIIAERLESYNRSFAPRSHAYLDLDKKIVDDQGNMIAGCIAGVSGWDTLHIDAFWMDKSCCSQDLASCLLGEIERVAKENGAYLFRAEGTEAQAAFFIKHGYKDEVVFDGKPRWCVLLKRHNETAFQCT